MGGEVKGKDANGVGSQQPCTVRRNTVYTIAVRWSTHTPRLPVVDWTDTPTALNGLVRFAERPNLVSARVPSCLWTCYATPRIINPVFSHAMPLDNNLATILSIITFLLLHNILSAIRWNRWLFHSLHILVSLFLWVTIFGQTYPHSLALSGTLVLYECVW